MADSDQNSSSSVPPQPAAEPQQQPAQAVPQPIPAVSADASNQQLPIQPAPTPILPSKISFFQKVTGFFHYLFGEGRIILFLIALGVILLKYGNLFIQLVGLKAKAEMKTADVKDAVLKGQEQSDVKQADALVQQAQQLPSQEGDVTEDWNVKK